MKKKTLWITSVCGVLLLGTQSLIGVSLSAQTPVNQTELSNEEEVKEETPTSSESSIEETVIEDVDSSHEESLPPSEESLPVLIPEEEMSNDDEQEVEAPEEEIPEVEEAPGDNSLEEESSEVETPLEEGEAPVEAETEEEETKPEFLEKDKMTPEEPETEKVSGKDRQPATSPTLPLPSLIGGSNTATINNNFRVGEVAQSSLGGFELPLLQSFEQRYQAAIVYEVVKQVGQTTSLSTEDFIQELFSAVLTDARLKAEYSETSSEQLQVGDIVYLGSETENTLVGLYLGNDFYAQAEVQENAQTEGKKQGEITIRERLAFAEEENLRVRRMHSSELSAYGEELIATYPASMPFEANAQTQQFIEAIGREAQELGANYDVFASVMIAQAILESASGTSQLAQAPYHNLFGIKGSYLGSFVTFPTQEDKGNGELFTINSAFRSYASTQASLSDYIQLIRGGLVNQPGYYEGVWRSNAENYLNATQALTGTFATDSIYNNKLNSLIATYNLTQYDEIPSSETGIFIQSRSEIPTEYQALMEFPEYNGRDYNTSGSYPVGQCTWYAYNRVRQLGGVVDDYMGNGGEWGTRGAQLGYQVSTTPKAGTLISFKPGVAGSSSIYGHVAFVEAVGPNGILISEGNVLGGTTISYRVIDNALAKSSSVSYIAPR